MISGEGQLEYTDDYPALDEYRAHVDEYYFRCNSKVAIKYAATGEMTLIYGLIEGEVGRPFLDGHLMIDFDWWSKEIIIRRTRHTTTSRSGGLPGYNIGWVFYGTEDLVDTVLSLERRMERLERLSNLDHFVPKIVAGDARTESLADSDESGTAGASETEEVARGE